MKYSSAPSLRTCGEVDNKETTHKIDPGERGAESRDSWTGWLCYVHKSKNCHSEHCRSQDCHSEGCHSDICRSETSNPNFASMRSMCLLKRADSFSNCCSNTAKSTAFAFPRKRMHPC